MKKENVIDLVAYRNQGGLSEDTDTPSTISEELIHAIQHLIYRLRELGPIVISNPLSPPSPPAKNAGGEGVC